MSGIVCISAVSIRAILSQSIVLFLFLVFISIFFTFLWFLINQIRVGIKCAEREEEVISRNVDEIETAEDGKTNTNSFEELELRQI